MRIAGREKLDDFVRAHAAARAWIENWIADTEKALWRTSRDIKSSYASASFLAGNVVIFNVKGNHYHYRLEVLVAYNTGVVVIRWAGTHTRYTKRMS